MPKSNSTGPQKITSQLIAGFQSAALLAGIQLEIFTTIGNGQSTANQIAEKLNVDLDRLLPLLNVLVVMGFLVKVGDSYENSEDAAHYLVKGEATYVGALHELYSDLLHAVLNTERSVREGRPVAEHDFDAMSESQLHAFFRGLHSLGVLQGVDLARKHEFHRFVDLADIGGGSGSIAIGACQACPDLRATVFELGKVVPIAKKFIDDANLANRVAAIECDLTREAPPKKYDVAVLRSFIQVLSRPQAEAALINVGKSMRPGGHIYVLGYVLSDDQSTPWEAAAYDIAFINIYQSGRSYTESEYREWMNRSGFVQFKRQLLPNNMSLISAVRA